MCDNLAIDEYGRESLDSHRGLERCSVTFRVKYFAFNWRLWVERFRAFVGMRIERRIPLEVRCFYFPITNEKARQEFESLPRLRFLTP